MSSVGWTFLKQANYLMDYLQGNEPGSIRQLSQAGLMNDDVEVLMPVQMENPWTLNTTSPCKLEQSSTRFLIFNYFLLSFTFIIGTSGNLLVCWVAFRAKGLRTGSNALLVNLAAGDLIRCFVDSPVFLALLVLRQRRVRSGSVLCRVQQLTYLLCSCAQLLTLAAISVERLQTIAFPFSTEKRRGRIRICILIIWIFAVAVAMSSLFLFKAPLSYSTSRHLQPPKLRALHLDSFNAYVLIPIWTLSVILIAVNYVRIFVVVKQHSNKIFDSGVQPKLCLVTRVSTCRLSKSSALESGEAEGNNPCSGPEIVGAVCVLTPKAKALGKARVEGKLAKRLGYIIATVVFFWMPLVLVLTLRLVMVCTECCSWLLLELETSAMVLTCVPAAVDPLIYTLLHHHFRTEFRKLFRTNHSC